MKDNLKDLIMGVESLDGELSRSMGVSKHDSNIASTAPLFLHFVVFLP